MTELQLAAARRALRHRIAAHVAALRAAEALGWPGVLRPQVDDTQTRLDEARACLAVIDAAIRPDDDDPTDAQSVLCTACGALPGSPCVGVPGFHVRRLIAALRASGE